MNETIIDLCEDIVRDIANHVARRAKPGKPFVEVVKERLKFENDNDWRLLCSLMDLLRDTEAAKENYMKYGLSGPTKIIDQGEHYLRLYGIVNAIYLQKSAIFSFVELVKLKDKNKITDKFNLLEIMRLRNIVGAHTVDFLDDGIKNPHQFNIIGINPDTIKTLDSKGKFREFNLKDLIIEYDKYVSKLMIDATEKFIGTVFKTKGDVYVRSVNNLELVKHQHKGDIVLRSMDGKIQTVVTFSGKGK